MDNSKYRNFAEKNKEDIISLLSTLVEVPSIEGKAEENFPFGKEPAKALGIILDKAEEMGFTVNNRDNYYATADYLLDGESKPSLAVLCHLDVVPAGKGWTSQK